MDWKIKYVLLVFEILVIESVGKVSIYEISIQFDGIQA